MDGESEFKIHTCYINLMGSEIVVFFFILCPVSAFVQEDMHPLKEKKETSKNADSLQLPVKVDVKPQALDHEISQRLENILKSTNWFLDPIVNVKDGVVFLEGTTRADEYKKWAGELAHNTQDTVAVVAIGLISSSR